MSEIYQPEEDSYLLQSILKIQILKLLKKNPELKFLEIGIGSGIQLQIAKELDVKNIFGVDINEEAVKFCKNLGFNCEKSNLFENINEKYDLIIFNPPYLPENKDEPENSKIATTGGEKGSEIINEFLKQSKKYLEKNGKIFLLTSSLTKEINWQSYKKKLIARKKLFFEELMIWELNR
jgi:release factor glutamine methyltransferase